MRAIAAGIACYKAVVVGKSAARVWEMPVLRDEPTTLCLPDSLAPPPRRQWYPGIRYVKWRLPHSDVVEHQGIRVACRSRVIFDVSRKGSLADGLVLIDHALRTSQVSESELAQRLERFAGLPGIHKVRRALELADGRSESAMESHARAQFIEAEIPGVEIQAWVLGKFRVDFLIDGWLVVETDGRGKYRDEDDLWNEKKRSDAILNAGFQMIRITNSKLNTFIGHESELVRDVRQRLALGHPLSRHPGVPDQSPGR